MLFIMRVNGLQHNDYVLIQIAIHDCVIKKGGGIPDPWRLGSGLSEAATAATAATAPAPSWKAAEAEASVEAAEAEASVEATKAEASVEPESAEGLCLRCR